MYLGRRLPLDIFRNRNPLDQIIDLDHGTTYRVEVRAVDLVDNVSVEVPAMG